MFKKLTLIAVAASVVFGSVGVGTIATAAPASAAVSTSSSAAVNRALALRQFSVDVGKIAIGDRGLNKAKGAQKAALAAQKVKASNASRAWFTPAYSGKATEAQLRVLRAKANSELGKYVSLSLQVR